MKYLLAFLLLIGTFTGGYYTAYYTTEPSTIDTILIEREIVLPARIDTIWEKPKPIQPKTTFTSSTGLIVYLTTDLTPSGIIGRVDSVYIPSDTIRTVDRVITKTVETTDWTITAITGAVCLIVGVLIGTN